MHGIHMSNKINTILLSKRYYLYSTGYCHKTVLLLYLTKLRAKGLNSLSSMYRILDLTNGSVQFSHFVLIYNICHKTGAQALLMTHGIL